MSEMVKLRETEIFGSHAHKSEWDPVFGACEGCIFVSFPTRRVSVTKKKKKAPCVDVQGVNGNGGKTKKAEFFESFTEERKWDRASYARNEVRKKKRPSN